MLLCRFNDKIGDGVHCGHAATEYERYQTFYSCTSKKWAFRFSRVMFFLIRHGIRHYKRDNANLG